MTFCAPRLPLRTTCAAVITAMALASCAWRQQDSEPHALLQASDIQLDADLHLASDAWPHTTWWTKYQDPQLNALIQQALRAGPSMDVARARLEQARAGVQQAQAASSATVMGTAQANYRWSSSEGNVALNLPVPGLDDIGYETNTKTGSRYSAGLVGRYSFDFWGLQASALRAALGAQNAQLAQNSAIEQELASAVATAYFNLLTSYAKDALLQDLESILQQSVQASESRKKHGLGTQTPIAQSKTRLLDVQKSRVLLRTQQKVLQEALKALVGANGNAPLVLQPAPLPAASPSLPGQISYGLLSRRPDLVALRWYVQASLDQVDIAKAAFYPSFDIKAFLGINHINLSDIVSSTSRQFVLLPGLTLPIFDGGRLNANLKRTRTASDVLITQYNQAVLNAVREVATSATQIQGLTQQAQIDAEQITHMESPVADARARAQRGKLSAADANLARIPLINQKIQLLDTQSAALLADVALIKALGGGYNAEAP